MILSRNARIGIAYLGLLVATFASYFAIAGSGVFVYAAAAELNGLDWLALIFTVENLFRGCMVPLSGRLGDKIGRKKLFLIAAVGYMVSSLACASATDIVMFVVGRGAMGMMWGLYFANLMTMVTDMYDEATSPKMTGYMMSVGFVAMIFSGTACGFLADMFSWRAIFYTLVPIVAVSWVLIAAFMPSDCQKANKGISLDVVGAALTAVAFGCLALLLNLGGVAFPWLSLESAGMVAIVAVAVALLVRCERSAQAPIFPGSILGNKACMACFAMAFFFAIGATVGNYWPTYAQSFLGTSATLAGALSLPSLIVSAIGASMLGRHIAKKNTYKGTFVLWGVGSLFFGLLSLAFMGIVPIWFIFAVSAVAGIGQMVQQVAPFTFPASVLSRDLIPVGVAFMSFGQQLGTAIANAVYGVVSNSLGFSAIFAVPVFAGAMVLVLALFYRDSHIRKTQ